MTNPQRTDPLGSLQRRLDEWARDEERENLWRLRGFLLLLTLYLAAEVWL